MQHRKRLSPEAIILIICVAGAILFIGFTLYKINQGMSDPKSFMVK